MLDVINGIMAKVLDKMLNLFCSFLWADKEERRALHTLKNKVLYGEKIYRYKYMEDYLK